MDDNSLFFRKVIIAAGSAIAAGSLSLLIFEWLDGIANQYFIAVLGGMAGGLVWQIEKYLLRKKADKEEK